MDETRIGLVGAGFIAATHLEAIRCLEGLRVSAVIDPRSEAAEALARKAPGAKVFASLAEAIAAHAVQRVHVLVPPQLHASVAAEAIGAGLPTLVEKPLASTYAEATQLARCAREAGVPLAVNQNLMFNASLARLAKELERGAYGRLRHVSVMCAVPLRQLVARQFGHWMFEQPANLLLEQMVHPISQLVRLQGRLRVTAAVASPAVEVAPDLRFHRSFDVTFAGATSTAQLHMAFGEAYAVWQLQAHCDDAVVIVDGQRGQVLRYRRTRFLDQADVALVSASAGVSQVGQAAVGIAEYVAAQVKLVRRSDAFFRSMLASIQAFHDAVDKGVAPRTDGELGAHLVSLCFDIARLAGVGERATVRSKTTSVTGHQNVAAGFDVAVLGGTGFIGKAVVRQLTAAGYSVGVMARNLRALPGVFHNGTVKLIEGDVTRPADVARGIGDARRVINLAHGGANGSREAIVAAMLGSAEAVARTCLARRVERLIHVSSIAALYLGDPTETIAPSTRADGQGAQRADYSFAKAEAERLLLLLHAQEALPVTIQRPGVVIGDGASPFHSGVGLFNNEQHCLGWSDGRNPLPFVLVEDCAAAIVSALGAPNLVHGRSDNIVGAVRLTAREYIDELSRVLGRPLKFHGRGLWQMQSVELGKWLIKRAGRRVVPFPSVRDLRSRGLRAPFDTSETERILNWRPTADRATFLELGIRVAGT